MYTHIHTYEQEHWTKLSKNLTLNYYLGVFLELVHDYVLLS